MDTVVLRVRPLRRTEESLRSDLIKRLPILAKPNKVALNAGVLLVRAINDPDHVASLIGVDHKNPCLNNPD